jgi:hypothetical protein
MPKPRTPKLKHDDRIEIIKTFIAYDCICVTVFIKATGHIYNHHIKIQDLLNDAHILDLDSLAKLAAAGM